VLYTPYIRKMKRPCKRKKKEVVRNLFFFYSSYWNYSNKKEQYEKHF